MTSPRFSILIPTRDRVETFVHTLKTVVDQPGDDFEIVVADNASRPGIREAVDAVTSCPIRYVRSDTILSMDANWEYGLEACTGEFVTVLGDDDAFVPSTLEAVRRILKASQAKLLSWGTHTYWWPDTIVEWNRNTLYVEYGHDVSWMDSRKVLVGFMNGTVTFGTLPMLYNAFAHRSLLDAIKQKHGRYFSIPNSPDLVSGVLLLTLTDRYAHSKRPLSVRGNSGRSMGSAYWCRSRGAEVRKAGHQQGGVPSLDKVVHPSLIPSPNLQILLASSRLWFQDLLFAGDKELAVDTSRLVDTIVSTLNFEPEAYDDNLADARALAAKQGRTIDSSKIPPRQPRARYRPRGPITDNDGKLAIMAVDGDLARLQNVHDAAWLAESLMPLLDTYMAP